MNNANKDAIETLRQLQKLSRELQPVKTALASLIKRERSKPNPIAAAGSLDKIAMRVVDVSRKYGAYFDRMSFLLDSEIPRLQRMTPLLEVFHEDGPCSSRSSQRDNEPMQDPFRYVCSPTMPHILKRQNYEMVRRIVCLHMEMVNYLISTERFQLARHVVEAYGLPLFWFPKLAALSLPLLLPIQGGNPQGGKKETETGSPVGLTFVSPFLTASHVEVQESPSGVVAPEHIAIQCIEARHSVTEAIAYCEEHLIPALKHINVTRRPKVVEVVHDLLIDLYATRLLQIFRDGRTDQQRVVQYIADYLLPHAARRPAFVQAVINAVTLQNEPYARVESSGENAAGCSVHGGFVASNPLKSASEKHEEAMQLVACMMSVEGYHKLAMSFHRVAVLMGSQIFSLCDALKRRQSLSMEAEGSAPGEYRPLPDLVTRVVATSILLKDEYFDRMVLMRRAMMDGGQFVPPIPESHLNTQSGSAAFDDAMMTVVEETLSQNLSLRPCGDGNNRNDNGCSTSGNGNNCGGGGGCGNGSETCVGGGPLTAAELLLAEERWSNDVLFIKRPTRFYCYLTRECFDGGTGGNCPLALPNGTVVSKLAVMQCCSKKVGEGEGAQVVVVCPRTKEEFSFTALRRIFVT